MAKSKLINVKLDSRYERLLRDLATESGESLSETIRRALRALHGLRLRRKLNKKHI